MSKHCANSAMIMAKILLYISGMVLSPCWYCGADGGVA